jgi:hypothetical protein
MLLASFAGRLGRARSHAQSASYPVTSSLVSAGAKCNSANIYMNLQYTEDKSQPEQEFDKYLHQIAIYSQQTIDIFNPA